MDAFEEEQKQGITIDTTRIQFSTKKRDYIIIDAPGHKEFLKNMISGATSAEAALLVVDAHEGVQEQSRRHAYMLSLLGIRKVYVLVNKMDLVEYSETSFQDIVQTLGAFLETLSVHPLSYLPVSGFCGDNIAEKSGNMPWYKGASLLDSLDLIEAETGTENKALRFPIQDVYKFDDRRIIAGRIEEGRLSVGDAITIYPGGRQTIVTAIPCWQEKDRKSVACAGEATGIQVKDEFFNQRGEIITRTEDAPPLVARRFQASIFWMGRQPMKFHRKYKLKLATQEVGAELSAITKIIDAAELTSRRDAEEVRINDVAEVILSLKHEIAFDLFIDSPSTGRFVLVDGYDVAGGGIVVGAEVEETGFGEKTMRYIMEHLPYNGELTVVVKDGRVERLERIEKEVFSGLDGAGI